MENETIERAIYLLKVAADFIDQHNLEELDIHYDGAMCDGACLMVEMRDLADEMTAPS